MKDVLCLGWPTILHTIGHTKSFSADDALGSNADDALVRTNADPTNASSVVGYPDGRDSSTCVSVGAPRSMVDSILTAVTGALVGCWSTSGLGGSTFGAFEVIPGIVSLWIHGTPSRLTLCRVQCNAQYYL
jgi:hypothetical protein